MTGRLFGIGLGPGDPELVTLKAARLISSCPVIAYPCPDTGDSFARSIAAGLIPDGAIEIPIVVPMRTARFPAQAIYDEAADRIAAHLDAGRDVAVLCEGDPFFYGSFMYLFARLAGRALVEVVPGVASLGAAAAAQASPLVARNEVMTVLPGPLPDEHLEPRIDSADTAVLMKVGRHLPRLRALIETMRLTDRAVYVAHASLPHQVVCPLRQAPETAPYFSMILVCKGADPWLKQAPAPVLSSSV